MLEHSRKGAPLLEVKNLVTSFAVGAQRHTVVQGVSFHLHKGEVLGIIGESGCGKTVTSMSLMRLIPHPLGRIDAGEVWFAGQELLQKSAQEFRRYRGREMAMIFQDPMTSLNPVLTIGAQLVEAMPHLHPRAAREQAIELLNQMGIPDPATRFHAYPHQLSGGMKQRVMIAMALAGNPQLLIADEPTTALDVTIQAQILHLLLGLNRSRGMALLLITHDLGLVAQSCDRVLVMYGGRVMESAPVGELFQNPRHPYTQGLMASIQSLARGTDDRLSVIPGQVPASGEFGLGCPFANRCAQVREACTAQVPKLVACGPEHHAACILLGGT